MSIKCMTRVWDQSQQGGTGLLMLLALADHANDDSICWPGIEHLAHKVRRSNRQAKSILRKLEGCGEIYIEYGTGRHNTNYYLVTVGLSKEQISERLNRWFQYPEDEANAIADQVIAAQKGEETSTLSDADDGKKGEVLGQKGEVLRQKGEAQRTERVKSASPEPSLNVTNPHNNHQDGAGAPQPEPEPEKEKREPTGKNKLKRDLSEFFSKRTQIPLPVLNTQKQRREASVRWWKPLLAIAQVCGDDLEQAKQLIEWAVGKMDEDDYTVSSPQSVEKVAIAEGARRKRERVEKQKKEARAREYQEQAEAQLQADRARAQAEAEANPDLALARQVWGEACANLAGSMTRDTFATWVKPLVVLQPNGTFRLEAPSEAVQEWCDNRLRPTIERALEGVVGRKVEVEFVFSATEGTCLEGGDK